MTEETPGSRFPSRRLARMIALLVTAMVTGLVLGWLLRFRLTAFAVRTGLEHAGAGDIRFEVTEVSPWTVELHDVGFRIRNQAFAAARIRAIRPHWWQSTLGAVRVEGMSIPLVVDDSDVNPREWPVYPAGESTPGAPMLPAEEVSIDGVIQVQAADLPGRDVTVRFDAHREHDRRWTGHAQLHASDLTVEMRANYSPATGNAEFHSTTVELGLETWQEVVQRIGVIPGGPWQIKGRVTGALAGSWQDRKLGLAGSVHLQEVDVRNDLRNVAVLGASADFEVSDFVRFRTAPGAIRIGELRAGDFAATNLSFEVAFSSLNNLQVSAAKLSTLGGTLSAEPFAYRLNKNELDATVIAEGLDVEQILSLAKNPPGAAIGRVSGRLPLRIDSAGVRFGTGWLSLTPGVHAEVTLRSAGLLTAGTSPSSPSFAVLKKVETGITRLQVSEMRLDIRPPDAPPGRTAQLHIVGEPVDRSLKAPITLDLNVNGPLEQLINLGLDRRVRMGSGK